MSLPLESNQKQSQHTKNEEQLEREAQLILMKHKLNEPVLDSNRTNHKILTMIGAGCIVLGLIGIILLRVVIGSKNPLSILPACLMAAGVVLMKAYYLSSLKMFSKK